MVEQGNGLAVRRGKWKFIPASNGPRKNRNTNTELGNDPVPQLYDLDADPGETRNVAESIPRSWISFGRNSTAGEIPARGQAGLRT